jgi:hypothetical protein
MQSERRKSYRFKPDSGFVCNLTSAEIAGRPGAGENLATRLLDVGAGGACLVTVDRFRERVPLIPTSTSPALARFKARASVRWSATRAGGRPTIASTGSTASLTYGDRLSFLGAGATQRRPSSRAAAALGDSSRRTRVSPASRTAWPRSWGSGAK